LNVAEEFSAVRVRARHIRSHGSAIALAVLAGMILIIPAYIPAAPPPCVTLTSLAYEKDNASERLVVTFDHAVTFKTAPLAGNTSLNLPWRVYADFTDTCLAKTVQKTMHPDSARIINVRVGNLDAKTIRIVFDFQKSMSRSDYAIRFDAERSAVIIDFPFQKTGRPHKTAKKEKSTRAVHPASSAPVLMKPESLQSAVQQPAPMELSAAAATDARAAPSGKQVRQELPAAPEQSYKQQSGQCVIVIDPGHGGKDPGAIGFNGIEEKDVALSLALVLKKHFDRESWCKTILTRSTDIFVSLERRAKIANSSNADVFLSIHTNSHEDEKLTGIETYYLDFSSDADARKVAARENFTTPDAIGDLEMILFDLLQSDKINKSSILAGYVHNSLIGRLRLNYPDIRNLGIKHAPMRVLIDAEMPCVILETAFISNPEEAKLLKNKEHQRLLALAIVEGVRNFRNGITAAAYARPRTDM
jgi:N-acetylmuramoyl-L-alanine amidase